MTHPDSLPFRRSELTRDPFELFHTWLGLAAETEPNDPNAMSLATVDAGGQPSVRMVLLKGLDERGFVFYTNTESLKGAQLAAVPKAGLCFHWKTKQRQVRVEGVVERVSDAEADAYYATRPRGSQIGAWASIQSRPLPDRAVLVDRIGQFEKQYADSDVPPRPPHWSGYRVVPHRIEFWQAGEYRLHTRWVYTRTGAEWDAEMLYP